MADQEIELNLTDAAAGPLASDLWRALLRPTVSEMYYDRIRSIRITRYEQLHCKVEIDFEEEQNGEPR